MTNIRSRGNQGTEKLEADRSFISWPDVAVIAAFVVGVAAVAPLGEDLIDRSMEVVATILQFN